MLPFEIRAIVPSYFNDYAVRRDFPLTAFSTCTPLCRRAKICLYLRHRAFRSEQSRHGWKDYYRSFALTKNSKYVKMRPPGKAGRPSEWNNTANAGRIVSKPKRQEDSSCVFACRFCRGTCHRRGTTGKRKCAEIASAQVRKKKFYKKSSGRCGVRTVKGEASSRPCMPQSECGAGHAGYASPIRCRADHRTPAELSAAEFSGLVSATAPSEQGVFAPCGFVLTSYK